MSGYFLLFALCCFAFWGIKTSMKESREHAIMVNAGHSTVEYLGGSPHINVTSSGYLRPNEDVLSFAYTNGKPINTKWENIKSVEVKTHEQLTKDVTLGRVLALGVFALAAKKQTVHTKQYLVVHCEEEGINYDMVFTGEGMGTLASRINRALIDYRKTNTRLTQAAIN